MFLLSFSRVLVNCVLILRMFTITAFILLAWSDHPAHLLTFRKLLKGGKRSVLWLKLNKRKKSKKKEILAAVQIERMYPFLRSMTSSTTAALAQCTMGHFEIWILHIKSGGWYFHRYDPFTYLDDFSISY